MALNPKSVQFFVDRIGNATSNTLKGNIAQLFEHLEAEVKDNPIFDKYENDTNRWILWPGDSTNSGADEDWEIPGNFEEAKSLAYSLYKRISKTTDTFGELHNITPDGYFADMIHNFNKMFLGYFSKALDDIMNANPELEPESAEKVSGTKVFIVHGHDETLKTQVQLLLVRAGVNNIVLHEQPDRGRTIIDKLIEEGRESNYAIGLLTPDDIIVDGTTRARQNVILEIGYFLGQLGKERVRMLVKGNIEIPSDLAGILYEKYDEHGAWRLKILKELMAVGIYADTKAVVESL